MGNEKGETQKPRKFTTFRFHIMGAIAMLTADNPGGSYYPDSIYVEKDFRRAGALVAIAVYDDPERLPSSEALQPYTRRDFQENFVKLKRMCRDAIDDMVKKSKEEEEVKKMQIVEDKINGKKETSENDTETN